MNLFDLTNKTVLITGASSGLGERAAKVVSKAGARVVLAARRIDKLHFLAKEIGNAVPMKMDITNNKDIISVFDKLNQLEVKIDVCINCAGVADATPIFDKDEDNNFEKIIQTNLIGGWNLIKNVATHMKNNNIKGSIITIGSINGDMFPAYSATAYSVSKAAVIHMTKVLVKELAPFKIRINTISPGYFKTEMTKEISNAKDLIQRIPLGYVADPSDLDGAILFLSSNQASAYMTGSCLTIDGGISWS